jgi:membrane protease YdiL (CAAX protease family)
MPEEEIRERETGDQRPPAGYGARLTPPAGLALLALSALLFFGGGLALAWSDPAWSLALLPLLAFLLPALLFARLLKAGKLVFPSSHVTPGRALSALSLSLGASLAALCLAGVISRWTGPSEEEALLLGLVESYSIVPRTLLFAVIPAICEEALFRGGLLASLRSWGAVPACVASGVLFALFHGSLQRMLPVAVLGVCLAAVVVITGNLWLAMAGHALHNGLILLALERYGESGEPALPVLATWAGMGLVLLTVGWLAASKTGGQIAGGNDHSVT